MIGVGLFASLLVILANLLFFVRGFVICALPLSYQKFVEKCHWIHI